MDQITDFLSWLYGSETLLRGPTGLIYPIALRPYPTNQPESVLGEWVETDRRFPATSWLLDELRQTHPRMWDGATYALWDLETTEGGDRAAQGLRLRCTTGSYFATVNTCMILEEELKRALAAAEPGTDPERLYQALPLRRALHGPAQGTAAMTAVWSGQNRSAAIGISCLFVVNHQGSYRYFVRRRSTDVADCGGLYHLVPSMVFQPTDPDPRSPQSYTVQGTILRELAEELFDRPESDRLPAGSDPILYPEIADLQDCLARGQAELWITGLAMDLLSLRPEILALMIVHDPRWLATHGANLSFSPQEYGDEEPGEASDRALEDDRPFAAGGVFAPDRCVTVGAAAAILGVALARQRTALP